MTQRRPRAKSAAADVAQLSFEEAYAQMQDTIAQLEKGELPLDDAVATFERGMRLAQQCNDLLAKAELRIQQLEPQSDGSFRLTDIDIETE